MITIAIEFPAGMIGWLNDNLKPIKIVDFESDEKSKISKFIGVEDNWRYLIAKAKAEVIRRGGNEKQIKAIEFN